NAVEAEWHSDCRVANAAVKAHRLDYDRMKERAEKAEAERDDAFTTITLQYKPKLEAAEETIDDLNRCVIREHERDKRAEDEIKETRERLKATCEALKESEAALKPWVDYHRNYETKLEA